ncbi:YhgE/Pip family protein [Ectobacillus polymachus]|uniref:YhgE/Pip family protein n=1 Tax=Ectobacillus polymachus TaxID=1508806 RepID=UPI003A8A5DC8
MRGFTLLGREFLAILKNKRLLIPIIAVLFVPILYAGMFLLAFWDPYSHLQDLPVAVVNLDKGAVEDGESFHVGDEFINNLKKDNNFKWEFVDEKTAMDGLHNRKYYMMVRVPANFSENATTLLKDHPEKLQLEYVPNESANFLSSQIGGSAVEKIKEEIGSTLSATYAEKMFANLQKVSTGFEDGSKGASQLHDATSQLKDGSQQLSDNLNKISDGAPLLYNGSSKLLTGSQQLSSGLNEMSSGAPLLYDGSQTITNKLGELGNGASQLLAGSEQLSGKLNEMSSGAPLLYAGSQKITNGLGELNSGLPKLYDGSLQLSDGLNTLNANAPKLYKGAQGISGGATSLADGASQWKAKADQASSGAKAASDGAQQVSDGLSQINQQLDALPEPYKSQLKAAMQKAIDGNKKVVAGTQQVADGTSALAAKAGDISKGASSLAAGADQLTSGLDDLKTNAPVLAKGASDLSIGLEQAKTGASQLAEGSGQLTDNLSTIKDGAPLLADGSNMITTGLGQVTTGANQLAAGSGQLTSGIGKMKDGAPLLVNGANQITDGLGQLTSNLGEMKDGAPLLANGSRQITDGLTKTNDGAGELSNKLGDGAKETGSIKANQDTYQMFASPVQLKTEKVNEVPNYGTGFAPYFLSLGLFVGALLISIVFPMRETVGIPKTGFSWFVSKFGILVGVGIFQSLIADLILLAGLKIHVQSIPMFILISIVTSITFLVLVQFFVTALGDAGRFMAIIILILQLTTSAGTFPLELLPASLQPLNAWLPMTYSVFGFKAAISSGDYSFLWQNIGILMLYIVLFTAATVAALSVLHKRQFTRTEEEK